MLINSVISSVLATFKLFKIDFSSANYSHAIEESLISLAFHHKIVTFVTHLKLKYGNQYYRQGTHRGTQRDF